MTVNKSLCQHNTNKVNLYSTDFPPKMLSFQSIVVLIQKESHVKNQIQGIKSKKLTPGLCLRLGVIYLGQI